MSEISEISIYKKEGIMILQFCSNDGNIIKKFNLGKAPRRNQWRCYNRSGYYLKDIYGKIIDFEKDNHILIYNLSNYYNKYIYYDLYKIDNELYKSFIMYLDELDKKFR
jgi:hypothetical protein